MRIGNGPRLVVPRAAPRRRGWGLGYYGNHDYERHLAEQRSRIRRMPHFTWGDPKRPTTWLSSLKPGDHYRRVDGHGKSTGPRLTATHADRLAPSTQVRRVHRQEEDLHSQLSRMLKRAHKLAMRED